MGHPSIQNSVLSNVKVLLSHFYIVFIRIDPEVVANRSKKILVIFIPELDINVAIGVNEQTPAVQMQLFFAVFTN